MLLTLLAELGPIVVDAGSDSVPVGGFVVVVDLRGKGLSSCFIRMSET